MENSVPKFTSFRSKVSSPKQPRDSHRESEEKVDVKQNKSDGHGKHERPRDREREKGSEHKRRSREDHHPPSQNKRAYQSPSLIDVEDDFDLFVVDRRGDSANLTYGTNSRHSIPEYRAPSRLHPLGESDAQDSDAFWKPRILSSRNKQLESNLRHEPDYIKPETTPEDQIEALSRDFIPLFSNRKRKRLHDVLDEKIATENVGDLSAKDEEIESRSPSPDTLSPSHHKEFEDTGIGLRSHHALLSNRTKQHPEDLQVWLEFIDFQDSWVRQVSEREKSSPTAAESRSIAEVRLSLYDEALTNIKTDHRAREKLLLGYLDEGSQVWESKKVLSQWKTLAQQYQSYLDLQSKYIDVIQTRFSFFTYATCASQYSRYLSILSNNKGISSEDKIKRQLDTFLKLSSMVRDTGFNELSRCLWQAMIEFNFFKPPAVEHDFEKRLSLFEKFWDGEMPRVGEEDASGWLHASYQTENIQNSRLSELTGSSSAKVDNNDQLSSWFAKENEMSRVSSHPARTLDEPSENDDPYRVVLFADIEPFLFSIEPEHHIMLVNAFLCFHQLPNLSCISSAPWGSWRQNALLAKSIRSYDSASMLLDMQSAMTTSETLFNEYQSIFAPVEKAETDLVETDGLDFVHNVLRLLMKSPDLRITLQEYYLAFVSARDTAKAAKTAKSMLKENPSDLVLYNTYGLIELQAGKEQIAGHLFPIAIQKSASFAQEADRLNVLLLHRTWIWHALLQSNKTTAINRLDEIAGTKSVLETLQNARNAAIKHALPTIAAIASELLALASYLPSRDKPPDLPAALETFRSESAILATLHTYESSAYAVEHLHQAQAKLVSYHMRFQPVFSPSLIRSALRPSLASFPTNTMFLTLYAENERRFRIDDRVRQIANEILNTEKSDADADNDTHQSIVPWCFAIKTELERGKLAASGATVHSIRAAFERAVTSDRRDHPRVVGRTGPGPSSSSIIWSAYLLWEVEVARESDSGEALRVESEESERKRRKDRKRRERSAVDEQENGKTLRLQRAKQVWIRGLTALPWVKDFVLLGIGLLSDCLSVDEVRGYVNMMVDKGLRVQFDFDDVPG